MTSLGHNELNDELINFCTCNISTKLEMVYFLDNIDGLVQDCSISSTLNGDTAVLH